MTDTPLPKRVDVAIVGAGTAGAAVAAFCAAEGMQVLCVDRTHLDRAGARWVNGVPAAAFRRAGIEPPHGAELRGEGERFHLIAGYGPARIVVSNHGVLEVDMRHLVARLQTMAREYGATLRGDVGVFGADGDSLTTTAGSVRAQFIVDASGLNGAQLLRQPKIPTQHICAAAQAVFEIADRSAARAFFDRNMVPMGETCCFTGVAGGFSIVNVRSDGHTVSLLTGSIPAEGHPSGQKLLNAFANQHRWVGNKVFGGARAIPLRRPFDRLSDGRVALIGDAASQVFPAHGSGIAANLIAARLLADALSHGKGLNGYAVAWQRSLGGTFACYDLFRRFSQQLTVADLEQMMEHGLMDPKLTKFGLAQQLPRPPLLSLPRKLIGLARQPAVGARLAAVAARMAAVRALYTRYPKDPKKLPQWSRRVAALFRDAPDVPDPMN